MRNVPILHARSRSSQRYNTDPASASSSRAPTLDRPMFDRRRIEQAVNDGLASGIPVELDHPRDALLAATLIDLGMPRFTAEQLYGNPVLRFQALTVWIDVQDAAAGDREARDCVDNMRAKWDEARRIELIADDPEHTIGLWER